MKFIQTNIIAPDGTLRSVASYLYGSKLQIDWPKINSIIIYPRNCPVHFALLKKMNVFPYSTV